MSSTRLPGKVMKPILGRPMLYRQIERIQQSKEINHLVVATSFSPEDDAIAKLCSKIGVKCFRGSLDDVLDRFYQAALIHQPEYVMRLTGDCPLFDPGLADEFVQFFLAGSYDYASNTVEPTYPDGLDMELLTFYALESSWNNANLLSEREHVTPFIKNHPEHFRIGCMENTKDLSAMRWTVDEPEDYEFVCNIYSALYPENNNFNWIDVLYYLENNPDVMKINSEFERDEGYQKSLQSDTEVKL